MRKSLGLLACAFLSVGSAAYAEPINPNVKQLLVSIAPDWNSSTGHLAGLERQSDGTWKQTLGPVPVLFGKNGLAWGRGILGTNEPGKHKAEHDGRAPAGVFEIGKIYTYDSALPSGASYPHHTVGDWDAWVDDPNLPEYNKFVTVDSNNPPAWFQKEKMRHNDFAYRWLVEIRHNADDPVPGGGSAIFFHIRRGETRPTSGCTTMAQNNLVSLIRWLNAGEHPEYVLLPWSEYKAKWKSWGLPNPEAVHSIAPK